MNGVAALSALASAPECAIARAAMLQLDHG